MKQKNFWLKFGVGFLIIDIVLTLAFPVILVFSPSLPFAVYFLLLVNPFVTLATFHINFLNHFNLPPSGIYFWPIAWFILGALVGLVYGKIKK